MNRLSQKWILGHSWGKDFSFFYLPSILITALVFLLPYFLSQKDQLFYLIFFAIVFVLLDSGHAYTSLVRTAYHSNPVKRNIFILLFFAIWIGATGGIYLNQAYFFLFLVYFTFFHHIRQMIGVFSWYQQFNLSHKFEYKPFFYSLATLSFLGLHCREPIALEGYLAVSLPHLDMPLVAKCCFVVAVAIYGFFLFIHRSRFKTDPGMMLSFLIPNALILFCFSLAKNLEQLVAGLLVLHATSYISLVLLSAKKMKKLKEKANKQLILLVFLIVFGLGPLEHKYEDLLEDWYFLTNGYSLFHSFWIGLAFTPLIWHYCVDGMIWKKTDEDFQQILT